MDEIGNEIRPDLQALKLVDAAYRPLPNPQTMHPPVVWAVDAFPDDLDLQVKTATALQAAFPKSPIHPVYVLNEDTFIDRGYASYLKPALKPMAFKATLRILSETHLTHAKKPRILNSSSTSRVTAARRLLRYAKKIGASTIAVGSHARRGLPKFFAGNFADELIEAAEIPILIAGPRAIEPHIEIRSDVKASANRAIVFPTDFSPACESAFERFLNLAEELKAELHILHRETYTVDPYAQIGMSTMGAGWVSMEALPEAEYSERIEEMHRADFERWRKRAEERSVAIRLISQNFGEPIAEAIVGYVESLHGTSVMLAMVSQTGPVAASLLGSITHDVIRLSPCPIYVAPRFKSS